MTEIRINEIEWMILGAILMLILLYVINEIREANSRGGDSQEPTKLDVRFAELQADLEQVQHTVSSIRNLLETLRPQPQAEEEFSIERKGKAIVVKDVE